MWGHPENKNVAWGATVDYFILCGAECIMDDRKQDVGAVGWNHEEK